MLKVLRIGRKVETQQATRGRGPVDHVILLDGTLSSLEPGHETNIGRIYRLLQATPQPSRLSLYYEAGVQWHMWRHTPDVAMGRGINRQIRRAYGWLATRYRPGDRVFLFGYSRGAYAVRSLAGMMEQVGLLKSDHATERNVRLAYRYYQSESENKFEAIFRRRFCHSDVGVEMIGVFDTVKALGVRLPYLWMWTEPQHEFHNHALGPSVKHGYHALALNENRAVFDPILWDTRGGGWDGRIEQMWFRGAHGDVGGQLGGFAAARALSNIPLVWMLEKAEACGVSLPGDWRGDFPVDAAAPSVGTVRGWGKAFLLRAKRVVGDDPSESVHPSADQPKPAGRLTWPTMPRFSRRT
ncbi:MAG: DUF2235 domain-containing protein [Albidovulum sp.]